ncbi:MHYT domain-containing protein [Haloglycomyces albus]|uniref:MHYT domain-containing protein n=1 Tax=Haloglycomyces albus TaxID=526067 RepID=UPI00046CBD84|nr:MHYT domain-containing protein [Haloglycomyces albus]
MYDINHFSYGWITPVMGFMFAFVGSWIALACITIARSGRHRRHLVWRDRYRWIALAALALGGTAVWMMHFTAMIGFRVDGSVLRYDVGMTLLSLVASIVAVSFGLFIVAGARRRSLWRVLVAGPPTGLGIVVMHYMGMHAINVSGRLHHDHGYVIAAAVIAVVAAIVALAFALWLRGRTGQILGALIMAVAICVMHYTGMMGVSVTPIEGLIGVDGMDPIMLTIPIVVLAAVIINVFLFVLFTRNDASDKDDAESSTPRAVGGEL